MSLAVQINAPCEVGPLETAACIVPSEAGLDILSSSHRHPNAPTLHLASLTWRRRAAVQAPK